ncbi:MAG: hypothetical protein NTX03_04735 [Bacteroidetes bacterium]|nr:hypothetical protein [Bacteroidota bacterium]
MKKVALILSLVFVFSLANAQDKDAKTTKVKTEKMGTKKETKAVTKTETKTEAKKDAKTSTEVVCCDSKGSTAYHAKKTCGALGKCKGKMVNMSKKDAEKGGKTACKMCCK